MANPTANDLVRLYMERNEGVGYQVAHAAVQRAVGANYLTKRESFAAQILAGMASSLEFTPTVHSKLLFAEHAVDMADFLLEALNRPAGAEGERV